LQTGNTTTGSVTIADGANGNITIAPDGTGDLIVQASGTTTLATVQNGGSYISSTTVDNSQAELNVVAEDASQVKAYALAGGTYINLTDTTAGNIGPYLELYHNSATPAANDVVGTLYFSGEDSGSGFTNYGVIKGVITDPTAASEDGKLVFRTITAGTEADELELTGAALYPTANGGLDLGTTSLLYNNAYLNAGLYFGGTTNYLLRSANALRFGGWASGITTDATISPNSNDGAALGTTALMWSDLFLAEGGVINWDNGDATITQSGNDVTLAGASLTARVKPRTGTTTSSATPTINTDDVDFYSITAQTVDITSFTTNLSGTPTDGQKLWISVTGTAARALTFGASFEASTVALPTTTVTTNRLDMGFVWNSATSKWRIVASA
jgi:hypothetical protein